jgi:hypothetical protein
MESRIIARIASGLLLGTCLAAWCHANDAPADSQPAAQKVKFEDAAVASLDSQVDAAAQAAPASEPPTAAQAGMTPSDDLPVANDRKSRLAALKARLHKQVGAEDQPPAEEEPVFMPPAGPMLALRQPQCLQDMGISLSGWLQQGITFNDDHPGSRFNGPVDTNDRDSEYQMNQFWMTMERPVNTGGNGWDFGGRIDATYGTDWRWYNNNGLENRINGFDGQTYGLMLPQAYAAVGYNDVTVKLGHFESKMDYESLPGPANFFYSHSYCYTYAVPHLVTGMLADYKVDGNLSVQGGFNRGWSQFEDDNHSMDVLGGFRWQSNDQRTIISYSMTNGPQDVNSAENRFVYSLVVQQKLGPRSQYVLVHDLGVENNAMLGGGPAEWYGLNQYYIYTLNNQWGACVRAEWFRDQDGVVVAGPGNMPGVRAWSGHGFAGNFYELTAGLNWRPQANVIFRPEVRYDWYDGAAGGYAPSNQPGLPFNDGRSNSQLLTAADLILVF